MRKARKAKAKAKAETAGRERAWDGARDKEKADITRIADKDRGKAEFEARARNNTNAVNRAAVEAAAKIRFSAEIQGAKRDREEDEARAKAEDEIKEKAEKISKREEAESRVREITNAVQSSAEEATSKIRVNAEAERAKI